MWLKICIFLLRFLLFSYSFGCCSTYVQKNCCAVTSGCLLMKRFWRTLLPFLSFFFLITWPSFVQIIPEPSLDNAEIPIGLYAAQSALGCMRVWFNDDLMAKEMCGGSDRDMKRSAQAIHVRLPSVYGDWSRHVVFIIPSSADTRSPQHPPPSPLCRWLCGSSVP